MSFSTKRIYRTINPIFKSYSHELWLQSVTIKGDLIMNNQVGFIGKDGQHKWRWNI